MFRQYCHQVGGKSVRRFAKMPVSCCVVGCSNRFSIDCGLMFYRFPSHVELRQRWVGAVRRLNADGSLWEPSMHHRICSVHFVGGKRSKDPLHPAYVPTLLMDDKGDPSTSSSNSGAEGKFDSC